MAAGAAISVRSSTRPWSGIWGSGCAQRHNYWCRRSWPAAPLRVGDGTAGNGPTWGYEILACTPDESINALVPHLADDNIVVRERATVALGYRGPAAAPARERVTAALAKVSSEREKRLMEWCLISFTSRPGAGTTFTVRLPPTRSPDALGPKGRCAAGRPCGPGAGTRATVTI